MFGVKTGSQQTPSTLTVCIGHDAWKGGGILTITDSLNHCLRISKEYPGNVQEVPPPPLPISRKSSGTPDEKTSNTILEKAVLMVYFKTCSISFAW